MASELLFRILLGLLLLTFVAHRAYWHRKLKRPREESSIVQKPGILGAVASISGILALIASVIYIVRPVLLAWASFAASPWLPWSGVVLAVAGFWLLQSAHQALGHNWSDAPALVKAQVLVVEGPYRWIRHPIYAAFLLILGAPMLISANLVVGSLWLVMTILEAASRISAEEALMLREFGDRYRSYMLVTGRLLPRIFLSRARIGR